MLSSRIRSSVTGVLKLEALRVLRYISLLLLCVCTQIGQADAQANKGNAKKNEAKQAPKNEPRNEPNNQDVYQSRHVRIVVQSPPGGGTAIVARVLGSKSSDA